MRILILKPSSLGDVVQAIPVLRLLKLHDPRHDIFWWIDSRWTELLDADPDLAGVIPFHRREWGRLSGWPGALRSIRAIRSSHFDWVIDLQALARSSVLCWLSCAHLRIGLEDPREGAPAFYDERVPRPSPETHAVDWYLQVLRRLEVPVHWNFEWLPARPAVQAAIVRKWNLTEGRPLVLFQPGARWENKRWPVERFAELARRLAGKFDDLQFGVLGSPGEGALGEAIARSVPGRTLDLTGRTGLWEMIELIRRAGVLVSNDTGPMHVAAALGTPVVGLFGPTDARRTGPYGQLDRVLRIADLPCAPCMSATCRHKPEFECLVGLGVDPVCDAVSELLQTSLSSRQI